MRTWVLVAALAMGLVPAAVDDRAYAAPGDATATRVTDLQAGPASPFDAVANFDMIAVNGTVFFPADDDGANGIELWKYDGTTATMVEDSVPGGGINPGAGDGFEPTASGRFAINGTLFFYAKDGTNGVELWKYDGTTATMVEDSVPGGGINPGAGSSNTGFFLNVNGTLYFSATDGTNGFELWKYDGTTATMVEDSVPGGGINPGAASSSPMGLTDVNGTLTFSATDGTNGVELWKTSGGTATMVEDSVPGGGINPGSASSSPSGFRVVNGTLYFSATDGTNGVELWKWSGGTATMVEDAIPGGGIAPGGAPSSPTRLTDFNGTLAFSASDGTFGTELWTLNGGTAKMVDEGVGGLNFGPPGSSPDSLTPLGGILFFSANRAGSGVELWQYDGATASMVEDSVPGNGLAPLALSSAPDRLTPVNGNLFFRADDGTNGLEPWKTSGGTAAMVEDSVPGGGINPGGTSMPDFLTDAAGTLFFTADDGSTGAELWKATVEGAPPPPPASGATPTTPQKKCKKGRKLKKGKCVKKKRKGKRK